MTRAEESKRAAEAVRINEGLDEAWKMLRLRQLVARARKGDKAALAKLTEIDRSLPVGEKVTPSLLGYSRTEILGPDDLSDEAFVGQDDLLAANEGGSSERAAMARRLREPAPTSSGYNTHLAYVRGLRPSADYPALVAAAKKAKKVTEPQLEAIAQAMFETIRPTAADQATLRKILRENLVRGGVTVVQGDDVGARHPISFTLMFKDGRKVPVKKSNVNWDRTTRPPALLYHRQRFAPYMRRGNIQYFKEI